MGGIHPLRFYSSGACLGWGFDPQISPFPGDQGRPSNTMCHWTPQVYLPNGV